ncbi:hypothetical protein RIF29_40764 [Crotalaria pallida]|uniref:Uncharacterized protein n=1 Tax=Crotalaria pallida TaxID=3830 RepID=A0AAN9HNR8_CROPI
MKGREPQPTVQSSVHPPSQTNQGKRSLSLSPLLTSRIVAVAVPHLTTRRKSCNGGSGSGSGSGRSLLLFPISISSSNPMGKKELLFFLTLFGRILCGKSKFMHDEWMASRCHGNFKFTGEEFIPISEADSDVLATYAQDVK